MRIISVRGVNYPFESANVHALPPRRSPHNNPWRFRPPLLGRKEYPMDVRECDDIRTTETSIDGTVYIVESVSADDATETVYDQIKRLVLSHAIELE